MNCPNGFEVQDFQGMDYPPLWYQENEWGLGAVGLYFEQNSLNMVTIVCLPFEGQPIRTDIKMKIK